MMLARPFHIGDRDPSEGTAPDGPHHVGVHQRGEIASALERRLLRVDAARDVDGEHEFKIDRKLRRDCRHDGCGEQRSEEHTSELQSLMRISYAVFCLTKKKQSMQLS